jgi:hypothetical protein
VNTIDARFGDYRDVLRDVEGDLLLADTPYSEETHKGHNEALRRIVRPEDETKLRVDSRTGKPFKQGKSERTPITYAPWGEGDVWEFVRFFHPRIRGWMVTITDDVLAPAWKRAMADAGRYVFAPLPLVEVGSRVRLVGDGPSSWTCWIIVSRPKKKEFATWGTLQGAYIGSGRGDRVYAGGKDTELACAMVRDYSRPGGRVVDPTFGSGTHLLAAAIEGRTAVGAESDRAAFELAQTRIARGYTPSLLTSLDAPAYEQSDLFAPEAP